MHVLASATHRYHVVAAVVSSVPPSPIPCLGPGLLYAMKVLRLTGRERSRGLKSLSTFCATIQPSEAKSKVSTGKRQDANLGRCDETTQSFVQPPVEISPFGSPGFAQARQARLIGSWTTTDVWFHVPRSGQFRTGSRKHEMTGRTGQMRYVGIGTMSCKLQPGRKSGSRRGCREAADACTNVEAPSYGILPPGTRWL